MLFQWHYQVCSQVKIQTITYAKHFIEYTFKIGTELNHELTEKKTPILIWVRKGVRWLTLNRKSLFIIYSTELYVKKYDKKNRKKVHDSMIISKSNSLLQISEEYFPKKRIDGTR